jgi:2-methylfumaryl-CoA isomerase
MWEQVQHPGVGSYLMPGTPLDFSAVPRTPLRRAPQLGEHTEEVLSDVLGLSATEVARLRRDAVISAATSATVDP